MDGLKARKVGKERPQWTGVSPGLAGGFRKDGGRRDRAQAISSWLCDFRQTPNPTDTVSERGSESTSEGQTDAVPRRSWRSLGQWSGASSHVSVPTAASMPTLSAHNRVLEPYQPWTPLGFPIAPVCASMPSRSRPCLHPPRCPRQRTAFTDSYAVS